MQDLIRKINESLNSSISFKLIEPNIDYDDDYKLEIIQSNKIIGYLIYKMFYEDEFEDEFEEIYDDIKKYDELTYIKELHIDKQYRSKGYGKKLFEEFIKKYIEYPCLLYVSNYDLNDNSLTNNELKKFYNSFKFKQINNTNYFIKTQK